MADPNEQKDVLVKRLDDDRRQMAVQVTELKIEYNIPKRLRQAIQQHPWPWVTSLMLTGYLLSRLLVRPKKIYVLADHFSRTPDKILSSPSKKQRARSSRKIWSLIKPLITAYLGREIYRRITRAAKHSNGLANTVAPTEQYAPYKTQGKE